MLSGCTNDLIQNMVTVTVTKGHNIAFRLVIKTLIIGGFVGLLQIVLETSHHLNRYWK